MTRKELKKKLEEFMMMSKGRYDTHFAIGNYGVSYNRSLGYCAICHIVKDDKEECGYYIEERFFQNGYEYHDILGKKFLDNSEATQIRKARQYFEDYVY